MGWEALARIDVGKSASHQLSQIEIASDNVRDSYLESAASLEAKRITSESPVVRELSHAIPKSPCCMQSRNTTLKSSRLSRATSPPVEAIP
jgi:hypothetical protein